MSKPLHFESVTRTKLRDVAATQLRAQITAGALEPGVLYSIGTVAAQLQVSSTPVREAVLELAQDELVEMIHNRGFRVRVLSEEELDELVELRVVLEVPAMGRLAVVQPPPDLSAFRPQADELVRLATEGDMVGFVALDREFHLGLTELLGNQSYVKVVDQLRNRTRLSGLSGLRGDEGLIASAREHVKLLDHIQAADRAATESLMTRHLQHARGLWAGRPETTD